jgi:hypothetical protein
MERTSKSPIVSTTSVAPVGGQSHRVNNRLIRFAQDCVPQYGSNVARIRNSRIDRKQLHEVEIETQSDPESSGNGVERVGHASHRRSSLPRRAMARLRRRHSLTNDAHPALIRTSLSGLWRRRQRPAPAHLSFRLGFWIHDMLMKGLTELGHEVFYLLKQGAAVPCPPEQHWSRNRVGCRHPSYHLRSR